MPGNMKILLRMLLLSLLPAACATPRFDARIEPNQGDSAQINAAIDGVTEEQENEIKVHMGSLPAGVRINGETVELSSSSPLKYLGPVHTTGGSGVFQWSFNDDRTEWCSVSNVLTIATGFLWSILPMHYPCWPSYTSDSLESVEMRKTHLLRALKRATVAAGGSILVVRSFGRVEIFNGLTGHHLDSTEMVNAQGWAFK